MEGIGQDRGRVPVGEIEELKRDSFLVGCNAEGREYHVDQSSVPGAFRETIVLEGGERDGWVGDWNCNWCRL